MEMRLIISPAKKMRVVEGPPEARSLPAMLDRAELLVERMRGMSYAELKALWACSDKLAELNAGRLRDLDLARATTPAILAYEGIQYQHLAPQVATDGQIEWLERHLRILSGLLGVVRPLDAVSPCRLEMQAKLACDGASDLYGFWGARLHDALAAECDLIVNLASVEYAKAVTPHAREGGPAVLTCLFGTVRDGRLVQRSTEAKAARGTFARWCAEREVADAEGLREFAERGYALDEGRSDGSTLVFVRDAT